MVNNIFSIFPYGRKKQFLKLSKPKFAYLYFSDHCQNLITGSIESKTIIDYLNELDLKKLEKIEQEFEVHHLTYELSDLILLNSSVDLKNIPLAIKIIYTKNKKFNFSSDIKNNFRLKKTRWADKKNYQKIFFNGKEELLNGNTYQFNLTERFEYSCGGLSVKSVLNTFCSLGENLGQFAHLSYIPILNKIILSNSPESLFQLKKTKKSLVCVTNPIKGTIKRDPKKTVEEQWLHLKNDKKNQAELYMIIDLLRNDLSSIEKPISKVIRKKALVVVPGLIHQMGVISIKLSQNVSVGKIIRSLFPGGSITGAPKISTYEILKRLESSARGHYTGSTLLIMNDRADCSINIRTAEIDLKQKKIVYGAGGGVTLLSDWEEEFKEMNDKLASFMDTFFKS